MVIRDNQSRESESRLYCQTVLTILHSEWPKAILSETKLILMGTLSGEATLPFYFFHFFSMETNSSWKEFVLEQVLSVKRTAHFGKPFLFKEANRKSFKFSPFETIVGQKMWHT